MIESYQIGILLRTISLDSEQHRLNVRSCKCDRFAFSINTHMSLDFRSDQHRLIVRSCSPFVTDSVYHYLSMFRYAERFVFPQRCSQSLSS